MTGAAAGAAAGAPDRGWGVPPSKAWWRWKRGQRRWGRTAPTGVGERATTTTRADRGCGCAPGGSGGGAARRRHIPAAAAPPPLSTGVPYDGACRQQHGGGRRGAAVGAREAGRVGSPTARGHRGGGGRHAQRRRRCSPGGESGWPPPPAPRIARRAAAKAGGRVPPVAGAAAVAGRSRRGRGVLPSSSPPSPQELSAKETKNKGNVDSRGRGTPPK